MDQKTLNRKVKILATVGPACDDPETLKQLIRSGVNGFRFNFSHGDIETHKPILETIRKISTELNKKVTCIADLQGPKIRVGTLRNEPIEIEQGDTVKLIAGSAVPSDRNSEDTWIPIQHDTLVEDFTSGNKIFLNEGQVELVVTNKNDTSLTATAEVGGVVWSDKGVNIPNVEFSVPALTEKDKRNLRSILDADFDMIALSFVRRADDLEDARKAINESNKPIDLIAKIESAKALSKLEEILESVEGIMVARGDLGVEIGPERVPYHQKEMIEIANERGKLVITATQMLESMVKNTVPTRAEVSDVANAILDGSDVLMLSGETAVGNNPVRSVETMHNIIQATEEDFQDHLVEISPDLQHHDKQISAEMINSAAQLANNINASAIVTPTASGFTARMISKTYPLCPIIAPSFNDSTRQKTALFRNVYPTKLEELDSTDILMKKMTRVAKELGFANTGDPIILLTGLPLGLRGVTNFLRVLEVK